MIPWTKGMIFSINCRLHNTSNRLFILFISHKQTSVNKRTTGLTSSHGSWYLKFGIIFKFWTICSNMLQWSFVGRSGSISRCSIWLSCVKPPLISTLLYDNRFLCNNGFYNSLLCCRFLWLAYSLLPIVSLACRWASPLFPYCWFLCDSYKMALILLILGYSKGNVGMELTMEV